MACVDWDGPNSNYFKVKGKHRLDKIPSSTSKMVMNMFVQHRDTKVLIQQKFINLACADWDGPNSNYFKTIYNIVLKT